MHVTDLKSGETLEDNDDALAAAASTQPGQQESEEGGATKVGGFRDEVSEILDDLQKPLRAVAADANTLQLRKRPDMPITESHGHVMIKKAYCQGKTNQFVDCEVVHWARRVVRQYHPLLNLGACAHAKANRTGTVKGLGFVDTQVAGYQLQLAHYP
eukprot:3508618-Rhodomonas_salina.1